MLSLRESFFPVLVDARLAPAEAEEETTERYDKNTTAIMILKRNILNLLTFRRCTHNNKDFIENLEGHLESLEIRITSRSNLIQKGNGYTGWIDAGISIGYEF